MAVVTSSPPGRRPHTRGRKASRATSRGNLKHTESARRRGQGRPAGPYGPAPGPPRREDASVGELVSDVTSDVQRLFRQELELAKAEVREEAVRSGKAAGMFGGAGFAGYMVALLLSSAAVFGLGHVLALAWSALIVTGVWALLGTALLLRGRATARALTLTPERTVETLKEDARWARHPNG